MLCESCNKRTANFHFTKIINGQIEEHHLCDVCAMENNDFDFDKQFSFHKLFTSLFDDNEESKEESKPDITCSNCGLSFKRFQETGKLGCAKCYDEFSIYLEPIVKSIHGHGRHRGKVPNASKPRLNLIKEVEGLNSQLEEAVKKEEFERAATIRDEIKKVKQKLQEARSGSND